MIDIREHGGIFGGSGLKPIGQEVTLKANEDIKKGEFIGLVSDKNQSFNRPTFTNVHGAYRYTSTDFNLDYAYGYTLLSDAGNAIMIRGRNSTSDAIMYVLKPYLDGTGKLSAMNYAFTIIGMIFSVTKLNGNTFAVFHSNSRYDTTGAAVSIIRIDDTTGEPSLLTKTVLFSTMFFKSFVFIPFTDDNLLGVFLYSTGSNTYGYSDSATSYFGKMSINPSFTSVSVLSQANQIKYTSGEAYGGYTNIQLNEIGDKVYFSTHAGDYSISWNSGSPILTTIRTSGVTVRYDSLNTFMRFNSNNYSIVMDSSGALIKYSHAKDTNVVTQTTIGGGGDYNNVLRSVLPTVDRKFLIGTADILNPALKNTVKPMGGNAFITICTNSHPSTAIFALLIYLAPDLNSVLSVVRSSSNIATASQYLDGNLYVNIDDVFRAQVFWANYVYYEGQGSFRYQYSALTDLAAVINPIKASNQYAITHGIAVNNAEQGNDVKCIVGNTVNTTFILGVK